MTNQQKNVIMLQKITAKKKAVKHLPQTLPILNGRLSHNIGNDMVLPEQGSYLAISESEKRNFVLNDATCGAMGNEGG